MNGSSNGPTTLKDFLNVIYQLICIRWSENMFGFAIVVGLPMIAAWARMLIFPDRIDIIVIIISVPVGSGNGEEIASSLDDVVFLRWQWQK